MAWRDDLNPFAAQHPQTGLCMSCAQVERCQWAARALSGIWYCEEFSNGAPDPVPPASPERPPRPTALGPGLCGNCDQAPTCRLAGRATGVWFCEEYR